MESSFHPCNKGLFDSRSLQFGSSNLPHHLCKGYSSYLKKKTCVNTGYTCSLVDVRICNFFQGKMKGAHLRDDEGNFSNESHEVWSLYLRNTRRKVTLLLHHLNLCVVDVLGEGFISCTYMAKFGSVLGKVCQCTRRRFWMYMRWLLMYLRGFGNSLTLITVHLVRDNKWF